MIRTDKDPQRGSDPGSDRALWQKCRTTDAPEDEALRFLDLAAFADRLLDVEEQERVAAWLADVGWPKPDLAEFHLKLIAAAASGLADPITIVDTQRRELLRRLRDAQRAELAEPDGSDAALLLEGIVLRLQADLRWLEACERNWTGHQDRS